MIEVLSDFSANIPLEYIFDFFNIMRLKDFSISSAMVLYVLISLKKEVEKNYLNLN